MPGAQGRADGNLLLTCFGAREQQVGHVGARDEQHEAHHAHQHQQGRLRLVTEPRDAPPTREQLVTRLRRAEGQLRGVQRMLEDGAECGELLTQLSAAKRAAVQIED